MTHPTFDEERKLWNKDYEYVIGIDEVGRGAFAGPLVAAAVILPKNFKRKGIRDSKLLTPKQREQLCGYIKANAISYCIAEVNVKYINDFGVGKATHQAFRDCLSKLTKNVDFVLVDGFKIEDFDNTKQKAIIGGDNVSISIAAASIIAKVYRDNVMRKLHKDFPQYNFYKNKGYGTKAHRDALRKYGLCDLHRLSFSLSRYTTAL